MVKTTFSVVVAAVAALGMFVVGASPANAVTPTLPSDQHLFVIDCDYGHRYLWSVNPANGMSTAVGSAHPTANYCMFGAQENPVDGKVYSVNILNNSDLMLSTLDTQTGEYTDIAPIHGDTDSLFEIMITSSGEAYGAQLNYGSLFRVDLATGLTTFIGTPGFDTAAIAYNPSDDNIYAFGWSGDAYRINKETGAATALPEHDLELENSFPCADGIQHVIRTDVYGATFDSQGNVWLTSDSCSQLLAADFASGEMTGKGYFRDASGSISANSSGEIYINGSIFITTDGAGSAGSGSSGDAEVLAETGAKAGFGLGYVSLSAVVLAVGVMLRRRRAHN